MVGQVHFRAASAGGNQFKCSRLLLLITTCAKRTGLGAAEVGLWTHHHHQPSSFYQLALPQVHLGHRGVSCKLDYFVIDVKHAIFGCSVISCKSGYFVIDVKHAVLSCFVIGCKSGIPRLFCNRCETSYLMERDLWFLLGEIFFSLLLLLSIDVFVYLFSLRMYSCTAFAFPKTAEHTTICSVLRTARPFFNKKCQF